MSSILTRTAIAPTELIAAVTAPDRGAIATFIGVVRDHQDGRPVRRLEYSAYEPMAEAEAVRVTAEAEARWPVRVALRHRLGSLAIGDAAVLVVVGSGHRAAAFDACRYVIEELKHRVPIWKKEFYADGTVEWVDPTARRPEGSVARPAALISETRG